MVFIAVPKRIYKEFVTEVSLNKNN